MLKSKIAQKIKELKEENKTLAITLEESKQAHDEWFAKVQEDNLFLMDKNGEATKLFKAATKFRNQQQIDSLTKTMEQDITEVVSRYLITDSDLVSPAGFHPSEKVFITNEVMIQADKLPKRLSRSLRYYDMEAIR